MEKDSSEWQLQGQPTVLLTLAHIFHRFAPLLVRGRLGGNEAGCGTSDGGRGWEAKAHEAQRHHLAGVLCDQSPRTSRMSPREGGDASAEGIRGCPRKKIEGVVTSPAKGTARTKCQRSPGAVALLMSPSDPGRAHLCLGVAQRSPILYNCGLGHMPGQGWEAITSPVPILGAAQGIPGRGCAHELPAGRRRGGHPCTGPVLGASGPRPPVALHGGEASDFRPQARTLGTTEMGELQGGFGKGPTDGCPGACPPPARCAAQQSVPQDYEVQDCLKQLMMSLLRLYRFSPIVPDLSLQVGVPAPAFEPLGPSHPL